jgi:hypothetical protein
MIFSERVRIGFDAMNRVLAIVGVTFVVGWESARIEQHKETGRIERIELEGLHVHPALRTPSWWPE